jgi:hypothetical protein
MIDIRLVTSPPDWRSPILQESLNWFQSIILNTS